MGILRWLARAVCVLYLALATAVLMMAASEGNGDFLATTIVVSAPLAAGALYSVGLSRFAGNRGRAVRALGWLAMVGASVALISFSFVVWPLLLLALPYSVLRDDRPVPRQNGPAAPNARYFPRLRPALSARLKRLLQQA